MRVGVEKGVIIASGFEDVVAGVELDASDGVRQPGARMGRSMGGVRIAFGGTAEG